MCKIYLKSPTKSRVPRESVTGNVSAVKSQYMDVSIHAHLLIYLAFGHFCFMIFPRPTRINARSAKLQIL